MRKNIMNDLWNKIKEFLNIIFIKEEKYIEENNNTKISECNKSIREKFQEESQKRKLADDIMNKKVMIDDLSDEQVQEMIEHFEKYINDMNIKLYEIKMNSKKSS